MRLIATGSPEPTIDGEHIILHVPSGKDTIEIVMTYHEAVYTGHNTSRLAAAAISTANERASAEILRFPRRKRQRVKGGAV